MKKKCILIYDDDLEILTVCRAILASENYRIEALTTCDKIISDIENLKPDLILMDLWIAKIGGEKAIQLMLHHEKTRYIPVILFSASNDVEKISQRAKATTFLRKPFDIHSFRKIIRENIL